MYDQRFLPSLKFTLLACPWALGLAGTMPHARAQQNFTFSTPSDPGAVSAGLADSVYHLGPDMAFNSSASQSTITRVATSAASHAPTYSYVNTTTSFSYNQGTTPVNYTDEEPTNAFLGSDATGLAATDATPLETTILDLEGYVHISQAGTYTIDSTQADDAVRVYLGGTGTAGSGTNVFERNYQYFSNPPTVYSGPATVKFTAAGDYPLEVLYYNDYSGGTGFAAPNLSSTPNNGAPAVAFDYAVPEPSAWALLGRGAGGLLAGRARRRGFHSGGGRCEGSFSAVTSRNTAGTNA